MKRLEAYGFKSFADKIEIEFHPGITAIVGPNGSGKSNVTDAVRWVLGEQNVRTLRGSKAEDIIFTGSATRRALGVAEASLFFENEGDMPVDYREVVVTRRLFRSGESEFFINKARCRLKDINNLFADTGLGRDGMSVIGQNRIDEILNSKPEERRLYFEETAGITKYRNRKRESMRKLEDMQGNLVRVSDIMQEIEVQIKPLAESAEKTRRHDEMQAVYKRCALTELFQREGQLKKEREESAGKIEAMRDETLAAETQVRLTEVKKEELDRAILLLEEKMQQQAEKNNALRTQIEQANSEIAILEERAHQHDALKARLLQQRTNLESVAREAATEKQRLFSVEEELLGKHQALDAAIAKDRTSLKSMGEKLREAKEKYRALADKKDVAQHDMLARENELLLIEHELERYSTSGTERADEWERATAAVDALAAEAKKVSEELRLLEEEHGALQEERTRKVRKKEQAEEKLRTTILAENRAREDLRNDENKLKFLRNMQASYEGFARAPKAVLQAKEPWQKGVAGAVAELISVPQEYIRAVEVALGSSLQNIVTEDTDTAKAAIAFLKRARLGRVTFLPLSTLVVRRSQDESAKKEEGAVGFANELVGAEGKFKKVADFLLARTLVVDTLDHGLAIEKKMGWRLRIVTLDGELLNPGGSLSGGGRQGQETSFLNRGGEIERLEKSVADGERKLATLSHEHVLDEKTAEEIAKNLAAVDRSLQQQAVLFAELRVKDERIKEAQREKEEEQKALKKLAEEAELTFAKAQEKKNDAVQQANLARRLYERMEREVKESEEELDDLEQDVDDLSKYINERELKCAVLGQEKIRAREQALLKEKEEERAKAQAEETRKEEDALDDEAGRGGTRREEIAARLADWQKKHGEGKAIYDRHYQEKLERHAENQENDRAAKAAGQRLSQLQGKLHQMELAAAEVHVKLEQVQTELLEQHGHTWETAAEEALDLTPAELKKKMQDISQALADLGPVNPNAIHEHEELLERYEFMGRQAADLEAARENLMAMIHEMDVTMTRQFKAAFQDIRGYFADIFVRLFGGGKAELFLTDEKDVLHAGVEIEVQLPAKKRQNLSVLSGGERALTVIALLFSFLRYRPAPFSVLDEIDAPLDEANVSRFGKFLGEFAENTQFIVVTHRKGTMEAADFMYGITIEDAGVSRVLSVRLDEAI